LSSNCPLFTAATRALGLFLHTQALPGANDVILESDILRSEAFEKIASLSSSSNPWIQLSVALILSQVGFAVENADDAEACINAGIAQAFLILLTSRHNDVRTQAELTIREFTKGAQFCNALFSAKIFPAIAAQHSTNQDELSPFSEHSHVILEILAEAKVSAPLEPFVHPGIIAVVVKQLTGRFRVMAEAAFGSGAVVRFRPVWGPNFSNLRPDHGSGSAIWLNFGLDPPERFEMVRFAFRPV
jgi:hypothetical protein